LQILIERKRRELKDKVESRRVQGGEQA